MAAPLQLQELDPSLQSHLEEAAHRGITRGSEPKRSVTSLARGIFLYSHKAYKAPQPEKHSVILTHFPPGHKTHNQRRF